MLTVTEAREIILAGVPVLDAEKVPLFAALGRILAEDVIAPYDLPPRDNSAMDGYAVRADDTRGAARATPVVLPVLEDLPAGYVSQRQLEAGQTMRIMTGAPLPQGANAVVRVEDTERGGATHVRIFQAVPPGYDIRKAGEDIREGATILRRGDLIRPAEVGLLASVGRAFIQVHQRAQVAILATGDELVEIDEPLRPGKIVNSNSYALTALVLETGAIPLQLGIGRDNRDELAAKFCAAARADVILSSGGVSMGDYDLVKTILRGPEAALHFWQVRMKPGKPLAFGAMRGKPTFGLPGNPVSAMVSYEIFVRPALLKMMGHTRIYRAVVPAIIEENVKKSDDRKHFVRVTLRHADGRYYASTTGAQGSGILSSMTKAHGLAVLDEPRMSVNAGETVPVMALDHQISLSAAREF